MKLEGAIYNGEKVYQDTSSAGCAVMQQQIQEARNEWDKFLKEINVCQRRIDVVSALWQSYCDDLGRLERTVGETERSLNAWESELPNTVDDKKERLQKMRVTCVTSYSFPICGPQ